jgi:hypothetical protein
MSLRRTVVVLGAALVTLLTVVILRAETTRLHSELSQLDRRAAVLWQELRENELELARLRNPALIRARVAQMRLQDSPPERARADAQPPDR